MAASSSNAEETVASPNVEFAGGGPGVSLGLEPTYTCSKCKGGLGVESQEHILVSNCNLKCEIVSVSNGVRIVADSVEMMSNSVKQILK